MGMEGEGNNQSSEQLNCVFNSLESHNLGDSTAGKVQSKPFLIITTVKQDI